ncbi:MAG: BRO family protein [Candidatus Paceibacterota bacterium]|jgi:prophage antirepressor-like protein
MDDNIKIAIFKGKKIRKLIYKNEWWFSVIDVVEVLIESVDAGAYWRKLKQRLKEKGSEVVTFCHEFKLKAPDGKMRKTDCANTEGMFRIVQSPKPNRLSGGWQKSAMSGYKK